MPATFTPNADQLFATVSLALDGELADAADLAPIGEVFSSAYYILKRLQHPAQPGPPITARADGLDGLGNADPKCIRVGPLYAVVIDTAVRLIQSLSEIDIDESNLEGAANYAATTWYHVYLRFDGVPKFEISTTGPDTMRLFKSGGITHRFLFSFQTDGNSDVRKFYHDRDATHLYGERLISSGAVAALQHKDLSAAGLNLLPAWARVALIRVEVSDTAAVASRVCIGPFGADVANDECRNISCAASSINSEYIEFPLSANQKLSQLGTPATVLSRLTLVGWKR